MAPKNTPGKKAAVVRRENSQPANTGNANQPSADNTTNAADDTADTSSETAHYHGPPYTFVAHGTGAALLAEQGWTSTQAAAATTTTTGTAGLAPAPPVPDIAPPIPPHAQYTPEERDAIDRAMRSRILPDASDSSLRHQYLEEHDFDLSAAVTHYIADRETVRDELIDPPDPTILAQTPAGPSLGVGTNALLDAMRGVERAALHRNIERQRRALAGTFLRRLNAIAPTGQQVRLSAAETILLLHMARWDVDDAVRLFTTQADALARLQANFSQFRGQVNDTKVRKDRSPAQERFDEALAILCSITSRSDWYSLRLHLLSHKGDLVDALAAWFRKGVAVISKIPKRDVNSNHYRYGGDMQYLPPPSPSDVRPDSGQNNNVFAPERNEFMSKDNFDAGGYAYPEPPLRQNATKRKDRVFGFIIDADRDYLLPGPPDWKALVVEYISKGVLHKTQVKSKKLWYSNVNGPRRDADPPSIDFSEEDHAKVINHWKAQAIRRITGELKREGSQVWTKEERDFLFQLHAERLDALKAMAINQGKAEGELLKVEYGSACMAEFARRMNARFQRERPREGRAVDTMRRRIARIVVRFRVKGDDGWVCPVTGRQLNGKGQPGREPEGEGPEDGGDGKGGKKGKKRKRDDEEEEDEDEVSEDRGPPGKKGMREDEDEQ